MREPLTPEVCDLTDFEFMPLLGARLMKSKAWLVCKRKPMLAFYMLNIWWASWHEIPAASIEDDDDTLADRAKCSDMALWAEIKDDVMRGFEKCSDGRLYHRVIAEKALEAWLEKLASRLSSGAGNSKRWGTKFDPAPITAQYDMAREKLLALNPMSKVFNRKRTAPVSAPDAPVLPVIDPSASGELNPEKTPATCTLHAAELNAVRSESHVEPLLEISESHLHPVGIARESKGRVKGEVRDIGGDTPPIPPRAAAPLDVPIKGASSSLKPKIELAEKNLALPAWLPSEAWRDFEETRWAKHPRAPYTLRAQKGLIKKLEELHEDGQDLVQVLNASVRNGWTDVFAIRGSPGKKPLGPFSAAGMNTMANADRLEERLFGRVDHATQ